LGLQIDSSFLFNPIYLYSLLIVFILSVILTGSYPAIILSSFLPIETIKGKFSNQLKGVTLRKTITIIQFTVSVTLVIVAFVIQKQLHYVQNKDLGMNIEQVLHIKFEEGGKNYIAFRDEVAKLTGVENISSSMDNIFNGWGEIKVVNKQTQKEFFVPAVNSDIQIFDVLDLKWMIPPKDKSSILWYNKVFINESAIKALGINGNPVGQFFNVSGNTTNQEIGGVLKDFHYLGTLTKIKPMIYIPHNPNTTNISSGSFYIKLNPKADIQEKLAQIKNIYEKYDNDHPFDYHFLDEAFNNHFTSIEQMSNMFIIFMVLAVMIACMGLFGLVTFAAETRTKEIGIRKVLGASVSNIVSLLSKDFVKLILVSFVIAFPIAWWAMNKWLEAFAYRIDIEWNIFAIAGAFTLLIALLTVSYQAIKAALANPVKSLRTE
jgi:putative ABC transport system permease protein